MEDLDDRTAAFTSGIAAAEQASSNLSKEMTALGDKPTTACSKIRDEANLLANELADLALNHKNDKDKISEVILTGGFSTVISPGLSIKHRIEKFLTLYGIYLISKIK